jgi:hypothetical protein
LCAWSGWIPTTSIRPQELQQGFKGRGPPYERNETHLRAPGLRPRGRPPFRAN